MGPGSTHTALGQPETDDERRQRQAREFRNNRLHLLAMECWVTGYHEGEVSLHSLCRAVLKASEAAGHTHRGQCNWVGHAVVAALANPPAKEGRANAVPTALKRLAAPLVARVSEQESLARKPSRQGPAKGSAFERVAKIFRDAGAIHVSERNIEDWAREYPAQDVPPFSKSAGRRQKL